MNLYRKQLRNMLQIVAGVFAIAVLGGFVQELNGSQNTPRRFGTGLANQQGTSISSDYLKKHGLFLLNTLGSHDFALKNQIFTLRADGSEKRLVTDAGMAPSWTSDGRIIFVSNRSGSAQIWIMDRKGRNSRQIGNLPPFIGPLLPQMSSNGLISFMGSG